MKTRLIKRVFFVLAVSALCMLATVCVAAFSPTVEKQSFFEFLLGCFELLFLLLYYVFSTRPELLAILLCVLALVCMCAVALIVILVRHCKKRKPHKPTKKKDEAEIPSNIDKNEKIDE